MKSTKTFIFTLLLLFVFIFQAVSPALACGPGYVSPIFDYKRAPENPFANFAAGRLGIIKPTYRRIVLFTAYRYLNGGSFTTEEQKGLVDAWNADFNNENYLDTDVSDAVKKWVAARKEIVKKEEKTPQIYTEREYGGFDFFPNCTKSAFETATKTLNDRASSHGAENRFVRDWIAAQDQVFENCASGQSIPPKAEQSAPEWLKKDREYQIAAANFYSLNYETAREIWTKIAEDSESVWADTADYLIARTLVREASLMKDETARKAIYEQAERHLQRLTGKGGEFQSASVKLMALVKYRIRPEERVRELAQILSSQIPNDNFRQDFIDYNWLLDKFESEALKKEDERLEELKRQEEARKANANSATNAMANAAITMGNAVNSAVETNNNDYEDVQAGKALGVWIQVKENDSRSFYFPIEKTDGEIITEIENQIGRPLTDKEKGSVAEARRTSYQNKTTAGKVTEYEGGYYPTTERKLSLVPDVLRQDDLTDWLFTYQLQDSDAYGYALERWRNDKSDLWLMTAISKADKNSPEIARLLQEAERADRNSPAFPTIAYNTARIYISQNKKAEARKLIDDVLNSSLDLPISSRNLFLEQRLPLAETLDEFLKYAQRKPFGFDFDGMSGTIDEIIAEQKKWYDAENSEGKTREQYEREVEEDYKEEKMWEQRTMFDLDSIEIMSQHFPLSVLLEAEKSPALPDYLRKQLTGAIWVRAILLNDDATAQKIAPEFVKFYPEASELFAAYQNAKTPLAKRRAALWLIFKNPMFSPYLESGQGKTDNEFNEWDNDDWWCAPYDVEYDDEGNEKPRTLPKRPSFLTVQQTTATQTERKRLKEIGDAPKFWGEMFIEWSRLIPTDKRVPEGLFISHQANGWTKYGCGNNEELQQKVAGVLRKRFPTSMWTVKLNESEKENQ